MLEYIVKNNTISQIRSSEEGDAVVEAEMLFENIIYLALTVDRQSQRAFILTVTSNDKEFSIESDDNNSILDFYQSISPFLLEQGFTEKSEDIDEDFYIIAMVK